MSAEEHDEAPPTYDVRLELADVTGASVTADAHLSGFFQPIDGMFRWHGRLDPDPALQQLADRVGRAELRVRVAGGDWVPAKLGERNPWGGYRVSGRGQPPFEVEAVAVTPSNH